MVICIDVGGTKTLLRVFSSDGTILSGEQRFATPQDFSIFFDQATKAIDELRTSSPEALEAISIGVPGIISDDGQVLLRASHLDWKNIPVCSQLQSRYDCTILLENDANLAGLAEARIDSHSANTYLYLTISTGIGAGIVVNNSIDSGLERSEVGHMLLEHDGRLQKWEDFASGKSITEQFGALARDIDDPHTWDDIADRIARGLYVLIPIIQPDIVIFGGSVGIYSPRFLPKLEELLAQQFDSYIMMPKILQAQHPDEAVIYGCYEYAKDHLSQ